MRRWTGVLAAVLLPQAVGAEITAVSLNKDAWFVVSGTGAEKMDNIFVWLDGALQPHVHVFPSSQGDFEALAPVYQLELAPQRTFQVRIVIGPAGRGAGPGFERMSWVGSASKAGGVSGASVNDNSNTSGSDVRQFADGRFSALLRVAGLEDLELQTSGDGIPWGIVREGTGPLVQRGQRVAVHFIGYRLDGTVFYDTRERNNPAVLRVGVGDCNSSRGWDIALGQMRIGERRFVIIPPDLLVSGCERGGSPNTSALAYDLELRTVP